MDLPIVSAGMHGFSLTFLEIPDILRNLFISDPGQSMINVVHCCGSLKPHLVNAFLHNDYGFSKYLISQYIEKSDNCVCLRLFGVFGKYEDYEYKFISNAIVKNLLQMPIRIRQNVYFDWLYINDLMKIVAILSNMTPLIEHTIFHRVPPSILWPLQT